MKKFLTASAVVLATSAFLASCDNTDTTNADTAKEEGEVVESEERFLEVGHSANTKTIDPSLNQATDGSIIIGNLFEGLYSEDENGMPVPAIAQDTQISEDRTVYTFTLADDAVWNDGEPVTANDFVFAWKRAVDPIVASSYSYQMSPIKNANAIVDGEMEVEELGVKAIDDKTLEVTLEQPVDYFINLLSFPLFMPLREDIVADNPDWSTSPETYISNGPFNLDKWVDKDVLTVVKNETYRNASEVTLGGVNFHLVEDEVSAFASFKSGNLDMQRTVPTAELESGRDDGTVVAINWLGTYYADLNVNPETPKYNDVLADERVRQALNLAIDRTQITEYITKGGQEPAYSFVPSSIKMPDGSDFSPEYFSPKGDVEEAQRLLAEAGYPNGEGFPTLEYIYNTSEAHAAVAQTIQGMWAENLGIDVTLSNEEWAVFQDTRNIGNFEIARDGWIGDYLHPMTMLELFTSSSSMNKPGWSNEDYDRLIQESFEGETEQERFEKLQEAEAILMEDMPVIPLYYYAQNVAIQPYVEGIKFSPLGGMDFSGVTINE